MPDPFRCCSNPRSEPIDTIPASRIVVSGADATRFLQAQLSNDVDEVATDESIPAAWLNAKGRVIWFGDVRRVADGWEMTSPADLATTVVDGLTRFRFRDEVRFEIVAEADTIDVAARILAGVPTIAAMQSGQFTAHMLNLDALGAVRVDKGCYPGQEIVARTHFRGASRRRLFRLQADAAGVAAGDRIEQDGRGIGDVVNAAGNAVLAVVPVDAIDGPLTVDGTALRRDGDMPGDFQGNSD